MTILKKLAIACGASALAFAHTPAVQAQSGTQYIAQVSAFGGNFCPREWQAAEGQLLPISQNTALFSLIGTTFGGDGRTTMALPDLRGRAPIGIGRGPGLPTINWGERGGSVSFTLNTTNMPSHNHTGTMSASRQAGDSRNPAGKVLAVDSGADFIYHTAGTDTDMAANILRIGNAGGSQSVSKRSPYLGMYWCIATTGIYPSRS